MEEVKWISIHSDDLGVCFTKWLKRNIISCPGPFFGSEFNSRPMQPRRGARVISNKTSYEQSLPIIRITSKTLREKAPDTLTNM
jgi:hypothetical protein